MGPGAAERRSLAALDAEVVRHPVWIGRDADGAVTCLVGDILVLHAADTLPPTVRSATRLPLFAPRVEDRRDAPSASPASTSEFIDAQIADLVEFTGRR